MARTQKKQPETTMVLDEPKRRSKLPLFLAIIGALAGLCLLLAVIHMSGALNAPEEAVYQRFSKNSTMSVLLRPLHHPDFKKTLTTEEALDVIQLRREMRKAADIINGQKDKISSLEKKVKGLEKDTKQLDKLAKDVKTLKESGVEVTPEAIMAALEGGAAPGAASAPAAAGAGALPALPAGAQGQSLLNAFQARDYRKVSKILDGMPAEQAADVLDALAMQDETFVVEVLATFKEDKAAEILQNFEPGRTGELLQKIASRRTTGT